MPTASALEGNLGNPPHMTIEVPLDALEHLQALPLLAEEAALDLRVAPVVLRQGGPKDFLK